MNMCKVTPYFFHFMRNDISKLYMEHCAVSV